MGCESIDNFSVVIKAPRVYTEGEGAILLMLPLLMWPFLGLRTDLPESDLDE